MSVRSRWSPLPDAQESAIDALEKMLASLPPITTLVERAEACGGENTPQETVLERMLQEIFADMPEEYRVRTLESRDLRWHCDCSEERLEKILMTIGEKDLTEIIEEDEGAELVCQFCCKKYYFDKEHLQRILAEMKKKKDDIAD